MKLAKLGLAMVLLYATGTTPAWAATATATVTATVPSRAEITLQKDTKSSVARFAANQIVFDRPDDQDGQNDGSASFMYAPYRSETNKNWHVARINANGSSMTLSAAVTGTAGTTPLANILKVFVGGFFPDDESGGQNGLPGTKSSNWESLNGYQKTLNQSFVGIVPFNYQLNIGSVAGGTYTGTVTYTLTSN